MIEESVIRHKNMLLKIQDGIDRDEANVLDSKQLGRQKDAERTRKRRWDEKQGLERGEKKTKLESEDGCL